MKNNILNDLKKLCNDYENSPYKLKLFYENLLIYAILEIFTKIDENDLIENIKEIKKISKRIFKIFKNKNSVK